MYDENDNNNNNGNMISFWLLFDRISYNLEGISKYAKFHTILDNNQAFDFIAFANCYRTQIKIAE